MECYYTDCRFFIVKLCGYYCAESLSVIMMSVVMLRVVALMF
jgi:hypothetical protein